MERRAILHPLTPEITCIDDAGASVCYVVCGKNRAAVIDTVNGQENLLDVVRSITDLPLVVINTHGHCDHIYGNVFFEEALLHPDDWALHDEHFAMKNEPGRAPDAFPDAKPCPLRPIREGDRIDLGGIVLEVVGIPGHTRGSIALLDRNSGFLFSGDAINGQLWMQLGESTKLSAYLDTLCALDSLRPYIRELHNGHNVEGIPAAYIDEMKDAIRCILETRGAKDDDYTWFGGDCRRHWMRENTWVLYTPDKL